MYVRCLLPNVTADNQLMDQDVIQNLKTIYHRNLLLKLVEKGYDNLLSFWKNLTVFDVTYYIEAAWKLVKSISIKKS